MLRRYFSMERPNSTQGLKIVSKLRLFSKLPIWTYLSVDDHTQGKPYLWQEMSSFKEKSHSTINSFQKELTQKIIFESLTRMLQVFRSTTDFESCVTLRQYLAYSILGEFLCQRLFWHAGIFYGGFASERNMKIAVPLVNWRHITEPKKFQRNYNKICSLLKDKYLLTLFSPSWKRGIFNVS